MSEASAVMNPWVTIWTRPRATVRHLIETDPGRSVLLLAALSGVSQTLDRASTQSAGDAFSMSTILLIAVLAGPLFGLIGLYIGAALTEWTGRWIGGKGTVANLRTAMAWSCVPVVASLALWVVNLALFGSDMFTTAMPRIEANPALALLLIASGFCAVVLGVWTLVLALKGIGEAQGFSAWKALGNVLLSLLILIVPIAALAVALPMLTS
jgi:hypothetical protein